MSIDLERFPWSDSANRMLTYVTKDWYDKSYVGKWIYEVMGRELDLATVHIEELPYQMFIDTATWGLKYHEIKYGLPVREDLSYEERRRLLREKKNIKAPMTPWRMEQILKGVTDYDVQVHDCNEPGHYFSHPNIFSVQLEGETEVELGEVKSKVDKLKQSHTVYLLSVRRRLENSPEFVASVIDQIAYEMSWHLKTRTVREHIYMVVPEEKLVKNVDIVDGMSGKIRTLGLEKMIMQLYEVLAKEAAGELWTAKVGLFQVASIPGRGQAYGKKYIERWMSRDPEGTKYCVQSDIKKCYPSMSHDKILEFLRRDLGKSDMLLYLFETLIGLYSEAKVQNKEKDCKHGIFIGSPVSKDLCNYYLSYLYHYCTNELYEMKTRRGKTTRKRLIYHIMEAFLMKYA